MYNPVGPIDKPDVRLSRAKDSLESDTWNFTWLATKKKTTKRHSDYKAHRNKEWRTHFLQPAAMRFEAVLMSSSLWSLMLATTEARADSHNSMRPTEASSRQLPVSPHHRFCLHSSEIWFRTSERQPRSHSTACYSWFRIRRSLILEWKYCSSYLG